MFIAIEGIDGSGKSTQVQMLAKYIETKHNKKVRITREPDDLCAIGHIIRQVLTKEIYLDPLALEYLFAAHRFEHYQRITYLMQYTDVVISDRHKFSGLAYHDSNIDHEYVCKLNEFVPFPDLSFYLSVDPKIAYHRIKMRDKATELYENVDKLTETHERFLKLADQHKQRLIVIDGEKPVEQVHDLIVAHLTSRIMVAMLQAAEERKQDASNI